MIIGETAYTAVPTSIINECSDGGISIASLNVNTSMKQILSGALTASIYKSLLEISSGRGVLYRVHAYAIDATSRTVGLKIILDGTTVFDAVSGTITTAGHGVVGIGMHGGASHACGMQPTPFTTSLDIQIKSSLEETDKVAISVLYSVM